MPKERGTGYSGGRAVFTWCGSSLERPAPVRACTGLAGMGYRGGYDAVRRSAGARRLAILRRNQLLQLRKTQRCVFRFPIQDVGFRGGNATHAIPVDLDTLGAEPQTGRGGANRNHPAVRVPGGRDILGLGKRWGRIDNGGDGLAGMWRRHGDEITHESLRHGSAGREAVPNASIISPFFRKVPRRCGS